MKEEFKNIKRSTLLNMGSMLKKELSIKNTYPKFIHIGKCGGTSIIKILKSENTSIDQYHLRKAPIFEKSSYFTWIRDPIKRYISAFNHSKEIATFDIGKLKGEKPTLENCQAPARIQIKIETGLAYSKDYENLLKCFESANHLAESLTGLDGTQKKRAKKLMNHPSEHIHKSIGWYLDNGKFVDTNQHKIVFCGSVENMQRDFDLLKEKCFSDSKNNLKLGHIRKNKTTLKTELSTKAKRNIYLHYRDTDYKAIESLVNFGFVDEKLMDSYLKFALSCEV